MKIFQSSKYYEIIISVALFIVLDAGVLGLNYFTSYQIADDAHAIHLSNRQTSLTQRILHELFQVRDELEYEGTADEEIENLGRSFRQFDEALDAFIYGAALIGEGQGQDTLLLKSNYIFNDSKSLLALKEKWKPYRSRIMPIIYHSYIPESQSNAVLAKTKIAIELGRAINQDLYRLSNQFANELEMVAKEKAQRLRSVQAVGILLAVLNFFVILFHFLKKLKISDKRAEKAKKETSEILDNVNEGLFLIDIDENIRPQYSASLRRLLFKEEVAGKNFLSLLKPLVDEPTLQTAKDYLGVMFSSHVNHELIQDLNPLNDVEIQMPSGNGPFDTRHLSFQFSPVFDQKKLVHLLTTVTDITLQVKLQNELEQSKKNTVRQIEQLTSIIHIEPAILMATLNKFNKIFDEINSLLRHSTYNKHHQFKVRLQEIARLAHKVKGESSSLGLQTMETQMHQFESLLFGVLDKKNIEGNDFLPITIGLNALHIHVRSLLEIGTHFKNLELVYKDAELKEEQVDTLPIVNPAIIKQNGEANRWEVFIERLTKDSAIGTGKSVKVDLTDFDLSIIPSHLKDVIKDTLVQFIRNAVAHGIEEKDERIKIGKDSCGVISIKTKCENDDVVVVVRDDGVGINLASIKEHLILKNGIDKNHVDGLSKSKLLGYLFKSGFSTSLSLSPLSGRGVGLDLVRSTLNKSKGKISVGSEVGQYTEFRVRFPLVLPHSEYAA